MSAQPSDFSQPQRTPHPNSLANLKRFEPGKSGNPGGSPKPSSGARVDVAYKKLISLSPDEFAAFKPVSIAETIAYRQVCESIASKKPLAYAQEIANRTDGAVATNINVNVETKQATVIACYARLYESRSRAEAHAAIDAIYDAPDTDTRKALIAEAIEADEAAIGEFWDEVEAEVTGNG